MVAHSITELAGRVGMPENASEERGEQDHEEPSVHLRRDAKHEECPMRIAPPTSSMRQVSPAAGGALHQKHLALGEKSGFRFESS